MKLYVICPDGPPTGGVEALHQLVDAARRHGWDAALCYVPARPDVIEAYRHYDVPVVPLAPDSVESIVVVPETAAHLLGSWVRARMVLWWLSVDNFFVIKHESTPTSVEQDPASLQELCAVGPALTHVVQSDYARRFLAARRVPSTVLTDYLSEAFMARADKAQAEPKRDLVLYNPKKGLAVTERLMEASRGVLTWQPIEGLDADGVADLLASAKLYVDFGEHPGRDRIPREAAVSGCAVITGSRGAAGNRVDLPIPSRFVLDEAAPDVVDVFLETATHTLAEFDQVTREFDPYRAWVAGQRDAFVAETGAVLTTLRRPLLRGGTVGRPKRNRSKR
jgi:hypothetical protein